MDSKRAQKEIFENKKRRGFNTTDIGKEIILLMEELGELAKAYRDNNEEEIADAVGDIMVYCLGLCEVIGVNSEELLKKTIENNRTRTHRTHL